MWNEFPSESSHQNKKSACSNIISYLKACIFYSRSNSVIDPCLDDIKSGNDVTSGASIFYIQNIARNDEDCNRLLQLRPPKSIQIDNSKLMA